VDCGSFGPVVTLVDELIMDEVDYTSVTMLSSKALDELWVFIEHLQDCLEYLLFGEVPEKSCDGFSNLSWNCGWIWG